MKFTLKPNIQIQCLPVSEKQPYYLVRGVGRRAIRVKFFWRPMNISALFDYNTNIINAARYATQKGWKTVYAFPSITESGRCEFLNPALVRRQMVVFDSLRHLRDDWMKKIPKGAKMEIKGVHMKNSTVPIDPAFFPNTVLLPPAFPNPDSPKSMGMEFFMTRMAALRREAKELLLIPPKEFSSPNANLNDLSNPELTLRIAKQRSFKDRGNVAFTFDSECRYEEGEKK